MRGLHAPCDPGSISVTAAAAATIGTPKFTIRASDMEPTYFAQYQGFEFHCSPERLGAYAFAPRLVIHDSHKALTLEIPIAMPTPPFDHPTAAAHQAFAHGRRWVDGTHRSLAELTSEAAEPALAYSPAAEPLA